MINHSKGFNGILVICFTALLLAGCQICVRISRDPSYYDEPSVNEKNTPASVNREGL